MASLIQFGLITLLLSISSVFSQAQQHAKSKSLFLPLSRDRATNQILTHLHIGTPPITRTFIVDLAGQIPWLDCYTTAKYSASTSSTHRLAKCGSAPCSVTAAACSGICNSASGPSCHNNTCQLKTRNPIRNTDSLSEVAVDTVTLRSTIGGGRAGKHVSIPNFILACDDSYHLGHLAAGVVGSVGLARSRVSVSSQLSSAKTLAQKFAICLPSSPDSNGIMFFGDSPYVFYPSDNETRSIDVSYRLIYTKLHTNYRRTTAPSAQGSEIPDYFVKISSILVEGSPIRFNSTLLEFHRSGIGGTRVSTTDPYTVLESSIYRSLVRAFEIEVMKTTRVKKAAAVAPLRNCYEKGDLPMSLSGLSVPEIALVFESADVKWDIFGVNSVVEVSEEVFCLGFVDGGPMTAKGATVAAVIGAYQMQGVLVQFDLGSGTMGFTNTLLAESVECSNFRF